MAKAVTEKENRKQKTLKKTIMKAEKTPNKEKFKHALSKTPDIDIHKGTPKSIQKGDLNINKKGSKGNISIMEITPKKKQNKNVEDTFVESRGPKNTVCMGKGNDTTGSKLSKSAKRRLRRERKEAEKENPKKDLKKALSFPNANEIGKLSRSQKKRLRRKRKREQMRQQKDSKNYNLPMTTDHPKLGKAEKRKLKGDNEPDMGKIESPKSVEILKEPTPTKKQKLDLKANGKATCDRPKDDDDDHTGEENDCEKKDEDDANQEEDDDDDDDDEEDDDDLDDEEAAQRNKEGDDDEDDEDFDDDEDDDDDDEDEEGIDGVKTGNTEEGYYDEEDFDESEDDDDFDDDDDENSASMRKANESNDEDDEDFDDDEDDDDDDLEDAECKKKEDDCNKPNDSKKKGDCKKKEDKCKEKAKKPKISEKAKKVKKCPDGPATEEEKPEPKDEKELTIFIGNIDFKATEEDVRKFVESVLSSDEIEGIELGKNQQGKPRGFGFLKVTTQEAFEKALKLNGEKLNNREIRMLKSEKRTDKRDSSGDFRPNSRGGFKGGFGGRGGSRGRGGFRGSSRGRGGRGGRGSFHGKDSNQERGFKKRPWGTDSNKSFDKPKKMKWSED